MANLNYRIFTTHVLFLFPIPIDENQDGKINPSEATGTIADSFSEIDTNNDNMLDSNELFWQQIGNK